MYVRAYLLLQKDLVELSDYVAFADASLPAYSFRMHSLLMRTCMEVEANCRAILKANGYAKQSNLSMSDFKKLEKSHRLSGYKVKVPYWDGEEAVWQPFASFKNAEAEKESPFWYKAYNMSKHDRHANFSQANLRAVIGAVTGLSVLLASQFLDCEFSPSGGALLLEEERSDGFEAAIGEYFRISYPTDWAPEMRYAFDWQVLKISEKPFASIEFE